MPNEGWVVGMRNGGSTKALCAATILTINRDGQDRYNQQFEPFALRDNAKNGFVHCGTHPKYTEWFGEGYGLQMIGPDMASGKVLNWLWIAGLLPQTLAEATGSGGGHLHYAIPIADLENGKWKNLAPSIKEQGITEIDVRGINGKSFCAGSDFRQDPACPNHFQPYTLIWDTPVLKLTHEEWIDIKHALLAAVPPPTTVPPQSQVPGISLTTDQILNIVDLLASSDYFPVDPDTPHTRHVEFLNIALLFKRFNIAEAIAVRILHELAPLVQTKPSAQTAEETCQKAYAAYHGILTTPDSTGSSPFLTLKNGIGANWTKLLSYLGKIEASFAKRLEKASKAAKKAEDRVMNGDQVSQHDKINQILDRLPTPIVYHKQLKEFASFNSKCYTLCTLTARRMIRQIVEDQDAPIDAIKWVLDKIQDTRFTDLTDWNQTTDLVCKNGVYHPQTRSFTPDGDPAQLISFQARFTYIPTITTRPPRYNEYVTKLYPDDPDNQYRHDLIMRDLLLSRFHRRKQFVVFYGVKNSGKSMGINLLVKIFGVENYAEIPVNKLADNFKTGSQMGKRIVAAMESEASTEVKSESAARLKKITGNDVIGYEKKGIQEVYGDTNFEFVLACNDLPVFNKKEKFTPITDRAVFEIYKYTYPQNNELAEQIFAEVDAIGSYLLNLPDLPISPMPCGYNQTPTEFWKSTAYPIQGWLDLHVVPFPAVVTPQPVKNIYEALETYLSTNGYNVDMQSIYQAVIPHLRNKGAKILTKTEADRKHKMYTGVRLLDDAELDEIIDPVTDTDIIHATQTIDSLFTNVKEKLP